MRTLCQRVLSRGSSALAARPTSSQRVPGRSRSRGMAWNAKRDENAWFAPSNKFPSNAVSPLQNEEAIFEGGGIRKYCGISRTSKARQKCNSIGCTNTSLWCSYYKNTCPWQNDGGE